MLSFRQLIEKLNDVPERPAPKWGVERRKKIVLAMARPDNRMEKFEAQSYYRKSCGASTLTHFFDEIATEKDMRHMERILGI